MARRVCKLPDTKNGAPVCRGPSAVPRGTPAGFGGCRSLYLPGRGVDRAGHPQCEEHIAMVDSLVRSIDAIRERVDMLGVRL